MEEESHAEAAAIARWCSTEQGWLATRVAHHRVVIEDAIADLTEAAAREPGPHDHAVILKVLDDLIQGTVPAAPPEPGQPVFQRVSQSLCLHCDKRTGSKTAKLCRDCRKAMRESGAPSEETEHASLASTA